MPHFMTKEKLPSTWVLVWSHSPPQWDFLEKTKAPTAEWNQMLSGGRRAAGFSNGAFWGFSYTWRRAGKSPAAHAPFSLRQQRALQLHERQKLSLPGLWRGVNSRPLFPQLNSTESILLFPKNDQHTQKRANGALVRGNLVAHQTAGCLTAHQLFPHLSCSKESWKCLQQNLGRNNQYLPQFRSPNQASVRNIKLQPRNFEQDAQPSPLAHSQ